MLRLESRAPARLRVTSGSEVIPLPMYETYASAHAGRASYSCQLCCVLPSPDCVSTNFLLYDQVTPFSVDSLLYARI